MLSKSSSNLKHRFLCYRNKQTYLIGKNVVIIIIPILISKGLFEPICKDLKFMVQNRNYICTSLITHFSYLGRGVFLHGCTSKMQPLLLTLDEGYLLTTSLSDLQRELAPLGPPAPPQPQLLGRGVAPPGRRPWPRTWGNSSWPLPFGHGVLPASAPDLRHGVAPLGRT